MAFFKRLLQECIEAEAMQEGFLWNMYLANRDERRAFKQEPYSSFQEYLDKNKYWLVRVYELEKKRKENIALAEKERLLTL
tara:strand:+ start:97 stop:339 length:243 start_codon:yes stop_codon:yes gene_type:complete